MCYHSGVEAVANAGSTRGFLPLMHLTPVGSYTAPTRCLLMCLCVGFECEYSAVVNTRCESGRADGLGE